MRKLITLESGLKIGDFLNKWFENKTFRRNQNIIAAFTGATGSGKSYNCLSTGEIWYDYKFKKEFPVENVCFNLSSLMKRIIALSEKHELRKGEFFILEEAGANFGNLDFQEKLCKMFSYILQSYRNMNIILFLTVPVLSMINKTGRQLIHAHFITAGINYETKITKAKPYMHQLSQATGKSYWKFPRIKMDGEIVAVRKLMFIMPSKKLIDLYERKKAKFVLGIVKEFIEESDKLERKKKSKDKKNELTETEARVSKLLKKGLSPKQIAKKTKRGIQTIYETIRRIKIKINDTKNTKNKPNY